MSWSSSPVTIPGGTFVRMPIEWLGSTVEYFIPSELAGLEFGIEDPPPNGTERRVELAELAVLPILTKASPDRSWTAEFSEQQVTGFSHLSMDVMNFVSHSPSTYDGSWLRSARRAIGLQDTRYREAFLWVSGNDPSTAWLVPPPSSALESLIADLAKMLESVSIHSPIKLGLAAYQLIHIHPFLDGNGRTARFLAWLLGQHFGLPGIGTGAALALGFRKKRMGDAMCRMRMGDSGAYLALLSQAEAAWAAARAEIAPRLEADLAAALSNESLAKRASILAPLYVAQGAITLGTLKSRLNAGDRLAEKYWKTLLDTGCWRPVGSSSGLTSLSHFSFESARHELVGRFLANFDNATE